MAPALSNKVWKIHLHSSSLNAKSRESNALARPAYSLYEVNFAYATPIHNLCVSTGALIEFIVTTHNVFHIDQKLHTTGAKGSSNSTIAYGANQNELVLEPIKKAKLKERETERAIYYTCILVHMWLPKRYV